MFAGDIDGDGKLDLVFNCRVSLVKFMLLYIYPPVLYLVNR